MNVLITAAGGFIGSIPIPRLSGRGETVIGEYGR